MGNRHSFSASSNSAEKSGHRWEHRIYARNVLSVSDPLLTLDYGGATFRSLMRFSPPRIVLNDSPRTVEFSITRKTSPIMQIHFVAFSLTLQSVCFPSVSEFFPGDTL